MGKMGKLFAVMMSFLMPILVFAQDASAPEPEPVSMVWVWTFVIIFFAACIGVPWYMWANERKEKAKKAMTSKA